MHCLIEPLLSDLDSDDESDGGQSVQFVKATGDPKKPQIFGQGQSAQVKNPDCPAWVALVVSPTVQSLETFYVMNSCPALQGIHAFASFRSILYRKCPMESKW